MNDKMMENSCNWSQNNRLLIEYHDNEWGVPLHDDRKLFEFLVLEGFQAGLSWTTILNKREAFRLAFSGFDPAVVAAYGNRETEELMQNSHIIRNRLKINATIENAGCFLRIQREFGSFDNYIWSFVNHKPIVNHYTELKQIPARTQLSDEISEDLKKKGFRFVGSTIVYAHMQATGMVNDHLTGCFRYHQINEGW